MWLVGAVIRRYNDLFPHIYPTPLVTALFALVTALFA